jgi:hypothetical protein
VANSMGLVSTTLDKSYSKVSIGVVTGSKQCLEDKTLKKVELIESLERLTTLRRMPKRYVGACD